MPNPDSKKYLPSVATIISLIVISASGIWAGSKIDTKANDAHNFVEENRALPEKICTLEKKMEKVEKTIESFDVMQAEQRHIIKDMQSLKDDIVRALKDNRRRNGDG